MIITPIEKKNRFQVNRTSSNKTIAGFSLYVHWPFCLSKCPYCDFNSHVSQNRIDYSAWRKALLLELDYFGKKTKGRHLESIFFGGGTPSLMPAETVGKVLDAIGNYWAVESSLEVTLEANPTSVEAKKFSQFREAGVNRVSIGVQSLDQNSLWFLGRKHSVLEALKAIEIGRKIFDRMSFDMIYARPGQKMEDWAKELNRALDYSTEHLSLYQLTIEKGTSFYANERDKLFIMPDDDLASELYQITEEIVRKSGFLPYEISNYSKPGSESLHNLNYWRGGEYVGIGPGAHGRINLNNVRYRTQQISSPVNWLSEVLKNGHATKVSKRLSLAEMVDEILIMGLRLTEGICREKFFTLTDRSLETCLRLDKVSVLEKIGLLKLDQHSLRATAAGRLRLNALIGEIVALNNAYD